MNDWDYFCKDVKPLQKKDKNVFHPKFKRFQKEKDSLFGEYDLHHKTLNIAKRDVENYILQSHSQQLKSVIVITGKSGDIKKEFSFWMEDNKFVKNISLKKNGGSFQVNLIRKKDKN